MASDGFFNVSLSDLLSAQVEVEKAKFGSRLGTTANQAADFNTAPQPQNIQAKSQSTKLAGLSTKQVVIGGGVIASALVLFFVMK